MKIHHLLRLAAAGGAAALLIAATVLPAHAEEPADLVAPESESMLGSGFQNGFAKSFDVVILRPLRFAALVAGVHAFVPAAIMTSPGGLPAVSTAYEVFIEAPMESVFQRRLGDF